MSRNIANTTNGAKIIFATDDFFGPVDNLVNPVPARFDPNWFTEFGKGMDGWETRRRRSEGHDFSLILLGVPTMIERVVMDTRYFTGNYPPHAALQCITWSSLVRLGAEINQNGGIPAFLRKTIPSICYDSSPFDLGNSPVLESMLRTTNISTSDEATVTEALVLLTVLRRAAVLQRAATQGAEYKELGRMGMNATEGEWRLVMSLLSQAWDVILPWTPIQAGTPETHWNEFQFNCRDPIAILRLSQGPDGGIARLHVFGKEVPSAVPALQWNTLHSKIAIAEKENSLQNLRTQIAIAMHDGSSANSPNVDFMLQAAHPGGPTGRGASLSNNEDNVIVAHTDAEAESIRSRLLGGKSYKDFLIDSEGAKAISCSNAHYGHPRQLLAPGRGEHMGSGWETSRRLTRPPRFYLNDAGFMDLEGNEWAVVRLSSPARLRLIEFDTNHFKGNYPESCLLEYCDLPFGDSTEKLLADGGNNINWKPLLPRARNFSSLRHFLPVQDNSVVTYIRITIFPDGGVMRMSAFGEPATTARL